MSSFHPDTRNPGGRKVIAHMMHLHQRRLLSVQPTFRNLHEFSPRRNKLSRTIKEMREKEAFKEVNNTFKKIKKVSDLKNLVDCSPDISDTLSHNKRLKRSAMENIHKKMLGRMMKRIQEYPLPHERRKNPWDTLSSPVAFIRNKPEILPWIHRDKKPALLVKKKDSRSLGEELLNLITENRLYKDEELDQLFQWARAEGNHSTVEEAIRYVKRCLD